MEENSEKHIHKMGERTSQEHKQNHYRPGIRPVGWFEACWAGGSLVGEKVQTSEQTAELQDTEVGKCHESFGVFGKR